MMINDMEKNELTEQEMTGVSGGCDYNPQVWKDYREAVKREEKRRQQEEARKEAIRRAEARQEAFRREQESSIHAHGGGVSGSW